MSAALRAAIAGACVILAACAATPTAIRPPPLPAQVRSEPGEFVVVTVHNDPAAVATHPGSTPRGYDAAGIYGVTSRASADVRALEREYGLNEVSSWPISLLRVHCIVFRVSAHDSADTMIARLAHDPRVESAQPLNQFTTEAGRVDATGRSGDPYSSLQVTLRTLAVAQAHRWSRGAGVRVAIIDTGADFAHPDLRDRVVERRNFVDTDEHQFRLDRHGTEVAGVIGADADNALDIIGIAPQAQLVLLKACWQIADGRAVCNSFTLAQALEAAIALRANVVNLSLAGPPDALLTRLIERGIEQGVLFVGAVAPAHVGGSFPADVPGVLAVESAEDSTGNPAHLLAPGRDVLTLVPGGRSDFASGSSFAAAEVSGTLALLLAERRRMSADDAHRILVRTSQRIETDEGALTSINACAALADALPHAPCNPATPVEASR